MNSPSTLHRLNAKVVHQDVTVTLVTEIGSGNDREEYRKNVVLPYLPRSGDQIAVGPDLDYMKVEDVFWCPKEGIAIWLECFERGSNSSLEFLAKLLEREGWLVWDEFKKQHLEKAA